MSSFRSFALVPAAGKSKRMGTTKLLLPWRDSTLIDHLLAAWSDGGVTKTVVIVDAENVPLIDHLRGASADLVVARTPPPEMKDSVQCGLEYVSSAYQPISSDVWLLAPADMPTLSPHVIQSLLAAHNPMAPTILVPTFQSRRGHPVLLPWTMAPEVPKLGSDQGINELVQRGPTQMLELGERAIPADIDTPEDYKQSRSV